MTSPKNAFAPFALSTMPIVVLCLLGLFASLAFASKHPEMWPLWMISAGVFVVGAGLGLLQSLLQHLSETLRCPLHLDRRGLSPIRCFQTFSGETFIASDDALLAAEDLGKRYGFAFRGIGTAIIHLPAMRSGLFAHPHYF